MKLMVAGLPGSGKTTQADKLSKRLKIPYVSMGALLRQVALEDSELGHRVKAAVSTGELVDDKLTAEILEQELEKPDYQKGFIVDGYPRGIDQLTFFDPKYDLVFYLKIFPEDGRKRLLKRHRNDDIPEVIDHRFQVQQKRLDPLLEELNKRYKFVGIDGGKSIEEIHQKIMQEVKDGI